MRRLCMNKENIIETIKELKNEPFNLKIKGEKGSIKFYPKPTGNEKNQNRYRLPLTRINDVYEKNGLIVIDYDKKDRIYNQLKNYSRIISYNVAYRFNPSDFISIERKTNYKIGEKQY